jgi:hypothetical protein
VLVIVSDRPVDGRTLTILPVQVTFLGFVVLAAATAAVVAKPVQHRRESPDQAVVQAFLVVAAT